MKQLMLDTNTVSHLLRGHPSVIKNLSAVPMTSVCISSITEAELLYGLAKRPSAERLAGIVTVFLKTIDILPWGSQAAQAYGPSRAAGEKRGKCLGTLDGLIAAHSLSLGMTLVTSDKAFRSVEGLEVQDWCEVA
jgi:tRNA(fMet)-specific endonuclease VapC